MPKKIMSGYQAFRVVLKGPASHKEKKPLGRRLGVKDQATFDRPSAGFISGGPKLGIWESVWKTAAMSHTS